MGSLKKFLSKDWRDRSRLKREGGRRDLSIDRDLGEAWLESSCPDQASPDVVYERRWASGILERSLARLAATYGEQGQERLVRVLAPMMAGPDERKTYAQAAEELGMPESNARVAAFRMRKRLRVMIREEVAATVSSDDEVDAELDYLLTLFGSQDGGAAGH